MCGRYALDADIDVLIAHYKAILGEREFEGSEEIFPTNTVPIIREIENRKIDFLKWGFMPSFTKKPLINARGETVDIKPTFKNSFIQKRCIIPATSFFEWEKVGDKKIRRRISIKEHLFSMAGLYNSFYDDGKQYEAFTILTINANEQMQHIHERMPVILKKDNEDIWLNNENKDIQELKSLIVPWEGKLIIE
ncbi:MAG: SOS response-associated peptidase [Tissierellia bacterium]|jgi:putative SOS response-associated peptidase YedK|nr:SOS response-associated peptidase [Tissierellia bacterium]